MQSAATYQRAMLYASRNIAIVHGHLLEGAIAYRYGAISIILLNSDLLEHTIYTPGFNLTSIYNMQGYGRIADCNSTKSAGMRTKYCTKLRKLWCPILRFRVK